MKALQINVTINIPALDRIADQLEGKQQAQIDALETQVETLTSSLQKSGTDLQGSVNKNQ